MKGLQQPLLWDPYRLPDIMLEATLLGRNGSRVGAPVIGRLLSRKGWWGERPEPGESLLRPSLTAQAPLPRPLLCAEKLCLPM